MSLDLAIARLSVPPDSHLGSSSGISAQLNPHSRHSVAHSPPEGWLKRLEHGLSKTLSNITAVKLNFVGQNMASSP